MGLWSSGLRRQSWKLLYRNISWVRIPPNPYNISSGYILMVDCLPSKQIVWVRISLSAFKIKYLGGITQLVECMLCKHEVIGSNPFASIPHFNVIAQLVERRNHNPPVVGSSPSFVNRNVAQLVARLFWE